jgi:hypothetical protein
MDASRSKHRHMLDYVSTRQRDVHDVHITCVMRDIGCWSDRHLVCCTVVLNLCPPKHRHACVRQKKLEISPFKMKDAKTYSAAKQTGRGACYRDPAQADNPLTIEDAGADIRDTTYQTAADVLGFKAGRRHQEWFEEHDVEARVLLDTMHTTHLAWTNDKNSTAKKAAYTKARQASRVKLRMMKEKWFACKSQELQIT